MALGEPYVVFIEEPFIVALERPIVVAQAPVSILTIKEFSKSRKSSVLG